MVFPLFAALHYWAPTVSGRVLSAFWVLFVGFNVAFLPMHWTGLRGMPRRVYSYAAGLGWDALNLLSTAGAALLAAGVAIFLGHVALRVRPTGAVDVNPWNAGTLEWLPLDEYGPRSIPHITSREPLWERPELREEVARGQHYLPGTVTGGRETLVTSAVRAEPQYVLLLSGDGWPPFVAAAGTAAFFLLLTVKLVVPAFAAGLLALAMIVIWLWGTDRGPVTGPVDVGGGYRLPVYATWRHAHSWWAMAVLCVVAAAIFVSVLFAYAYLWKVAPAGWPPGGTRLPAWGWPAASAVGWGLSSLAMVAASRALAAAAPHRVRLLLVGAALTMGGGFGAHLLGQRAAGLAPAGTAHGAIAGTILAVEGFFAAVLLAMAGYALARSWCGHLTRPRRVTFDNTALLWHYSVAQTWLGLGAVHALPRLFD